MRPEDTGLRAALDGNKMISAEWLVYGQSFGIADVQMVRHMVPYSKVYVCFNCGDAWGKIHVINPNTKWICDRRLCPQCGPGVMGQTDQAYNMPQDAAIREIPLMRKCKDYDCHLVTGGE